MTEEANVENMIMYIPVEVETVGATPSSIISGLKTLPPPRPNAPETHPPRKANIRRSTKGLPRYERSVIDATPHFSFNACSRLLIRTPMKLRAKAVTMNAVKMVQSRVPHFVMPMIDGVSRDPLRKFTTRETEMMIKASPCLRHCFTCDFSSSSSLRTSSYSSLVGTACTDVAAAVVS